MWLGEKILTWLSRSPETGDYRESSDQADDQPLRPFITAFPDFVTRIQEKTVLDFGCGTGAQVLALAEAGAHRVVGLDINPRWLRLAGERSVSPKSADKIAFIARIEPDHLDSFDVVVSKDCLEHVADPKSCLEDMKLCCRPNGLIYITFGPPWYAPYGSHMRFFTRLPWVNLLFSERTVMKVRSRYRNDGAMRYEEVESGLNRMTVARFEQLISRQDVTVLSLRYYCVKQCHWLRHLPILRELFINQAACVLQRTV